MPALEDVLRRSTWFRTPLDQAGLLSRRSVASAASWSLCRRWSEAPRRSGFDAAREAIRLNREPSAALGCGAMSRALEVIYLPLWAAWK